MQRLEGPVLEPRFRPFWVKVACSPSGSTTRMLVWECVSELCVFPVMTCAGWIPTCHRVTSERGYNTPHHLDEEFGAVTKDVT